MLKWRFLFSRSGWGLRLGVSNQLPHDTNFAGTRTMLPSPLPCCWQLPTPNHSIPCIRFSLAYSLQLFFPSSPLPHPGWFQEHTGQPKQVPRPSMVSSTNYPIPIITPRHLYNHLKMVLITEITINQAHFGTTKWLLPQVLSFTLLFNLIRTPCLLIPSWFFFSCLHFLILDFFALQISWTPFYLYFFLEHTWQKSHFWTNQLTLFSVLYTGSWIARGSHTTWGYHYKH